MQTTLVQTRCECLSRVGQNRAVAQLSSQQVVIRWDRLSFQLRPIDLCVIKQELEQLIKACCVEKEEDYILFLNEHLLYLSRTDLNDFYTMVCDATEQLPRFVIRWKEVRVMLRPYDLRLVTSSAGHHVGLSLCIN